MKDENFVATPDEQVFVISFFSSNNNDDTKRRRTLYKTSHSLLYDNVLDQHEPIAMSEGRGLCMFSMAAADCTACLERGGKSCVASLKTEKAGQADYLKNSNGPLAKASKPAQFCEQL